MEAVHQNGHSNRRSLLRLDFADYMDCLVTYGLHRVDMIENIILDNLPIVEKK
jgi:hypothetical protein